jgi:hypothetical protein
MKLRFLLGIIAFLSAVLIYSAQTIPIWKTKGYHSLLSGNELYSDCQEWERNTSVSADNRIMIKTGNASAILQAGECHGYIMGIVDSIPAGEGFNPAPDVLMNQYVDVVYKYLLDHPELRHLTAYELARTALTEAFPTSNISK